MTLCFILVNIDSTKEKPAAPREGQYLIEMMWNEGVNVDIDLWVKAPNGETVGWKARDSNTMSLLRDDLGNRNDFITKEDGTTGINPLNREEISVRSTQEGRYLVNIHYFAKHDAAAPIIKVQTVLRKADTGAIVLARELLLDKVGDEKTAFIFVLNKDNSVKSFEYPVTPELWVVNLTSATSP
jgi:uncharacterized protein YfaP (DUF2135 family)